MSRRAGVAVAAAIGAVVLSGCGPTLGDLPLPGNGVSGDTITIEAEFDEALNLAQGAQVKVNGVSSGKVQSVEARDFKAVAVLEVRRSAEMRAEATARLRYTTPLGELFVEVTNPAVGTELEDGATLSTSSTSTAPTVEDALSSASLLVNGGGLNQLQTVTDELNAALGGREDTVRELLDRANTFLGEANATTDEVDRALTALAAVSKVLAANRETIAAAITDFRPAAEVLRQNTPGLTRLLAKLERFSDTANGVVGETRDEILRMLRQVSPVLDEFIASEPDLGPSLRALVKLNDGINAAIPGDYANMKLEMQMDKVTLPNLLGTTPTSGTGGGGGGTGDGLGAVGDLLDGLFGASPSSATPVPSGQGGLLGGLATLLGGGR